MSVFYMFMAMGGSGTQGSNGVGAAYFYGEKEFSDNPAAQATITELLFPTETTSYLTTGLSRYRAMVNGVSSTLKGYFLGGKDNFFFGKGLGYIDSFVFSTKTATALGISLYVARGNGVDANSATRGYVAGGQVDTGVTTSFGIYFVLTDDIESIVFATEQRINQSVTLSVAPRLSLGGASSSLAGYFAGGITDSTYGNPYDVIDKLAFSSEIRTALSARLGSARYAHSSFNSQTTGYFAGGQVSSQSVQTSIEMDALSFDTETRATIANTILLAGLGEEWGGLSYPGTNSKIKGYISVGPAFGTRANLSTQLRSFVFNTGLSTNETAAAGVTAVSSIQSGAL